jgi:hypothetical protein
MTGGTPTRATARWLSVVLLLIEGLSGASVGVTLLAAVTGLAGSARAGEIVPAIGIPAILIVYGLALVAAAVGILFRRAWGWWLAIGPIVAGLALLLVLWITIGSDDAILLGGVAVWGITLVALLAIRPSRPA